MCYKIATILGARPQFIKAAALSSAIDQEERLAEVIVHTGQHYDHNMSGAFFDELQIPTPAHHLGIGSGRAAWQTGKMIVEIDKILAKEVPDAVLVYGDTNSTLAAALAAQKPHSSTQTPGSP